MEIDEYENCEAWIDRAIKGNEKEKAPISCYFPTKDIKKEFLEGIAARSEDEVLEVLRCFLFAECTFVQDEWILPHFYNSMISEPEKHGGRESVEKYLKSQKWRRRILAMESEWKFPVWPSIRWVIDLLPYHPNEAIEAVRAFWLAHIKELPDQQFSGLNDAIAVIRAKYLLDVASDGCAAIKSLSTRDFEHLAEAVYRNSGYQTILTKKTRDGGRDVIAYQAKPDGHELVMVECKHYDACKIGVEEARALESIMRKNEATRSVILTVGSFSHVALEYDERVSIVGFEKLGKMLNSAFGRDWNFSLDSIVAESRQNAVVRNVKTPFKAGELFERKEEVE